MTTTIERRMKGYAANCGLTLRRVEEVASRAGLLLAAGRGVTGHYGMAAATAGLVDAGKLRASRRSSGLSRMRWFLR